VQRGRGGGARFSTISIRAVRRSTATHAAAPGAEKEHKQGDFRMFLAGINPKTPESIAGIDLDSFLQR
jgi:hypothetical protein